MAPVHITDWMPQTSQPGYTTAVNLGGGLWSWICFLWACKIMNKRSCSFKTAMSLKTWFVFVAVISKMTGHQMFAFDALQMCNHVIMSGKSHLVWRLKKQGMHTFMAWNPHVFIQSAPSHKATKCTLKSSRPSNFSLHGCHRDRMLPMSEQKNLHWIFQSINFQLCWDREVFWMNLSVSEHAQRLMTCAITFVELCGYSPHQFGMFALLVCCADLAFNNVALCSLCSHTVCA